MALTLESCGYTYPLATGGQAPALAGVSLGVEQGELVLVLGATGSGKSTLLRIAAGLLSASEGRASVDGAPLSAVTARGVVGIVFQDPEAQLFADTVAQDVAFGPTNLGVPKAEALARALETLERVGLPAQTFAERSPFALSGGEARRAAIAGVLAMAPRYLLLDEPTAGLDSRGRRAVRELIAAERERCGVVVVSHSAEEFLAQADRVLLLQCGHAAFRGTREQLLAAPQAFAEAGLLAPDILRVQMLAAERGAVLPPFTLDVAQAAAALAHARGVG